MTSKCSPFMIFLVSLFFLSQHSSPPGIRDVNYERPLYEKLILQFCIDNVKYKWDNVMSTIDLKRLTSTEKNVDFFSRKKTKNEK